MNLSEKYTLASLPHTEKGCIYMITSPSNKSYIGKTANHAHVRLKQHVKNAKHRDVNYLISKAIRKYAPENMSVRILAEGVDEDNKLDALEVFYIDKYNTFGGGYNQTKGGDGTLGWYDSASDETREAHADRSRKTAIKTMSDPERYKRFREGSINYVRSDFAKTQARKRIEKLNSNPEFKEMNKMLFIERLKKPEVQEAIRLGVIKRSENIEWRKGQAERFRKYYSDPDNYNKHIERLAVRNSDQDFQKRRLAAVRAVTQTKEWHDKNSAQCKLRAKIKESEYSNVVDLYSYGFNGKEIAKMYEVKSRQTIYNILAKNNANKTAQTTK